MNSLPPSAKDTVISIVSEAGEKAKHFLEKGFSSHSKGGVDFATEADVAIDTFLQESLRKAFPTHSFLTEETAPSDYSSLYNAKNLWVIDPIDGTVNFSRGSSHCAISVGLVDRGLPRLGVAYAPLQEKLYYAEESTGAFLNNKAIHVSSNQNLKESVICCDWSWNIEKRKKTHAILGKVLPDVRAVGCRGSAVLDVASLAAGEIDAYFIYGINPWDIAASALIAQKAGASIYSLDQKPWNIFSSDILVTNGKLDEHMLQYFK